MSIRQPIAVFFCIVMAIALLWSVALLTISAVALVFFAVTDIQIEPLKIRWLLTPKAIKGSIRAKPYIWSFTLFFFLYLLSVIYAGNISEWWSLTHMKLAFLIIPLAFAFLPSFTKRDYMLVMACLMLMTFWSSIWVQVAYFQNYYLFTTSLGFGGSLPTPTGHIRYSVIIAICMVLGLSFAIENMRIKFAWERWVYGFLGIYFFYFLHLLSVRSGIMLGYAGIILLVLFYLRRMNIWKQVAIVMMVALFPFIAYKTVPTFKQKINYTLYDLKQFNAGEGEKYSDAERWQSWRAGIDIGNEHPFFGTGTGHFRSALRDYYKTNYKRDSFERPHNQFINVFAIFGLFGLCLFVFILIYPMTFRLFWSPPWIPILFLMQILSMMVEHPLDVTVGTSMFLLISLLGLSYQSGEVGAVRSEHRA
jgi:O-antigen ligase